MLYDLIRSVRHALVHYVKMIEGEDYQGTTPLTEDYVKSSKHLTSNRLQSILWIMHACEEAEQSSLTPQTFAQRLLDFANSMNSNLGKIFGYQSRFQRLIISAIASYDPDLIKYYGYKAFYVEHSLEDMPSPSSTVESVPIQQANLFISMIVSLREDNKLLTERLDRQEELFQELRSQNLELRESLSRAQLELIRLRQPVNEPDHPQLLPQ